MTSRLGMIALAAALVLGGCACAPQSAPCRLSPTFSALASQLPDGVGTCQGPPVQHAEIGQTWQPTTSGRLVANDLDGVVGFDDGATTTLIDPRTHNTLSRPDAERFPFEFNGDGFPLVGTTQPEQTCPTAPLKVVAVENFYGDLLRQIGGSCVQLTTILDDPTADPHEYQPTADDVRAFQSAQLVVENGLGYDAFSDRIIRTLAQRPAVLNAGDQLGLEVGANPHVWYSVAYVDQLRAAMLAELERLAPAGDDYFQAHANELERRMATYHHLADQIAAEYAGTPVGATESIFGYLADSTELRLISPPGFMQGMSEGNEPSARDLARFHDQISRHQIGVLVYNTQTVTSATEQLEQLARDNSIPLVGVSETQAAGALTFQGWQAAEMQQLLRALQSGEPTPR